MTDEAGYGERSEESNVPRSRRQEVDARNTSDHADDPPLIPDGAREIFERSPVATAVVDGMTRVIRYANAPFQRLASASRLPAPGSLNGRSMTHALPPAAVDGVSALLQRVYETEQSQQEIAIDVKGDDGESVTWSVTAWSVLDRSGLPDDVAIQVRANDTSGERQRRGRIVDELREVNERLLLAALREQELREKAQAASEAKSAFLATMSHELRTPLNAIIGYQELLAEGITSPVTDAQRVQLDRIKQSATHLLALIDELLTITRVEANRESVRREPVDIDALLDEAVTQVAPLAAAKGLQFATHRQERAMTVASDPLKIRQILVNLLGNAVKFTERGEVTLSVRTTDDRVMFEVHDTGIGIAASDLGHVFEPFWQANQTPIRTKQGSGLGLSVSRHLSRLLGGDLSVESTESRGSTFTFWLPRDALQRDV